MDAAGLGDVVRGLLLGEVGNVPGHGRGDDKRAAALLLEVRADGLCAVGGAVQVGLDDMVPVGGGAVDDTRISGRAGAAGNKVSNGQDGGSHG